MIIMTEDEILLQETIRGIRPADAQARKAAWAHWDSLCKPLRGFGKLEEMVAALAGIQRTDRPHLEKRAAVIMGADNGVVAEGVSQCGSEVTEQVLNNMGDGISSVCVMSRILNLEVLPVNIGMNHDAVHPRVRNIPVRYGTGNIAAGPAMSREECISGIVSGIRIARELSETGYDLLHEYYLISSFGLSRDSICELNCVDGSVDFDKMASGEEVLIFAPEDLVELTTKNFTVGQILPLSDVVVSEEEEDLPFGNIDYFDPGVECTYREHIKTDSGDNVIVAGKAYGKRKDINTKVGAIISVSDEQIHEFFGDYSGLGIICLDNRSFSSWGLPNRNYTDFKVKLRDDASRSDFDKYWYETIGECKGIRINSTYHLWDKIYMSNASNMTVYYLILFTLFITGCLSVTVSLYTKIKIRDNEITILRRLGMTVGQVRLLIISQNIFYPVIGTLIGIIPVYVLQSVFDYIKRKMESGAWDNKPGVEDATAWFFDLPYYKNMFDYNFVPALIVCLIIGVVLIVIGTIPQMIILRRHKLIEN